MRSSRYRVVLLLLAVLAIGSCAQENPETWGFVATLGSDTTSVERITRRGDRIVSEAVGRSPLVVRRRWEATFAPDGSLRLLGAKLPRSGCHGLPACRFCGGSFDPLE